MNRFLNVGLSLGVALLAVPVGVHSQTSKPAASASSAVTSGGTVGQLVTAIRQKAKASERSPAVKSGFQKFTVADAIPPESISYPDYVIVRLIYEATRDAGFWNVHWQITNQPPNSDRIWSQWSTVVRPSFVAPTAIAECDELSALFAFLVERAGVKNVGLLWPFPNHTVAVWSIQPASGRVVRIIVPTSQIFLDETDDFDTKKFNAWRQKVIYEYMRRDVADSFEIPKPLADFFLAQIDKYGEASDATLQGIRYLRDGVLGKVWTPEQAASEALKRRAALRDGSREDALALQNFAEDMRAASLRR